MPTSARTNYDSYSNKRRGDEGIAPYKLHIALFRSHETSYLSNPNSAIMLSSRSRIWAFIGPSSRWS